VFLIDNQGAQIGERTNIRVPVSALKDKITGKQEYAPGGCCSAYAKELHWRVGPLSKDTIAEDFIYAFRALLGNGIVGIEEPLVYYRQHDASILGKSKNDRGAKRNNLIGTYSRLLEYKKAMNAYNFSNGYMRWRLNRRIKTFYLAIQAFDAGLFGKVAFTLYSLITLRFELMPSAIRYVLYKIRSN
jgi:hypothetical protein